MYVQLTCAIVDADANNRQELAGFLARFGIPVVAQLPAVDGLAGLLARSEGPTLVIVNLDPGTQQTLRAISHLPRQHPHVSFFLMSQLLDANLLMEAMHLGVKEFIPLPMSEDKFTAALERVAQTQTAGQAGKVIHVIPTMGGCGSTTVACNVAASLAKHGKTVLIDLDLVRGGVASYFDMRPRFTIADVMEAAEKLDKHAARQRADAPPEQRRRGAGPAGPAGGHAPRERGPACRGCSALLGRLFDYVVVDSVMSIDPIYSATIAAADVNLLVMQLNVPSAKNAERFVGCTAADGDRGEQDPHRRQPLREEGLRHRAGRGRAGAGPEDRVDGPQRLQERDRRDQLRRAGGAPGPAVGDQLEPVRPGQHAERIERSDGRN